MRRTTLALLIFAILTATAGCSLLRSSHKLDSPQAPQVVRGRIIPACQGQSGRQDRPQRVRVRIEPYMYTYQVAWSARTEQFILTNVTPKTKPLERAHKVRLAITLPPGSAVGQASSQARLTANGGQAGKPSRPAPGKPLNQSGDVVHAKVRMEKETIHFSFGSAAISRSEQIRLRRVASRIKKHHGQKVSVTGYTCWIGPKKVNDRLALARAMAVVHELGKEGVKVGSVSCRGRCCYIDLKHAAPNRRAEISWEEGR